MGWAVYCGIEMTDGVTDAVTRRGWIGTRQWDSGWTDSLHDKVGKTMERTIDQMLGPKSGRTVGKVLEKNAGTWRDRW